MHNALQPGKAEEALCQSASDEAPVCEMFPVCKIHQMCVPVFRFCLVQVLQAVVLADNIIHLLHLCRKGASSSSLTADQGKDSQADVSAGLAQIFSPEGLCCAGSRWIFLRIVDYAVPYTAVPCLIF